MIKIQKTHNFVSTKKISEKKYRCRPRFRETQTPKLHYKCNSISNCKISSYEKKKEKNKTKDLLSFVCT